MAKRAPSSKPSKTRAAAPAAEQDLLADIPAPDSSSSLRPAFVPLSAILGQEHALRILADSLDADRLHHAWIFSGPLGVGKRTTALAFAARLLAADSSSDPTSHPDIHLVTKELAALSSDASVRTRKQTVIPREVIQEFLLGPAALAATAPRTSSAAEKAFILDEAELLEPSTQNVLLKTLEEPPPGTVIILITSSEDRLLPTIRSRCQRVAFRPLDAAAMSRFLASLPSPPSPTQRDWLLATSSGSPGVALVALTHQLHDWSDRLAALLDSFCSGRYPPDFASILQKFIDERADLHVKANPDASKDAANKAWSRRTLALLAEHARARLRASSTTDRPGWLDAIDAIVDAESALDANVNMLMAFEALAAHLAESLSSALAR